VARSPSSSRCAPEAQARARRGALGVVLVATLGLTAGCSVDTGVVVDGASPVPLPSIPEAPGPAEVELVDPPAFDAIVTAPADRTARPYDEAVAAAAADHERFWAATYPEWYGQPWRPLLGGVYAALPGDPDIPGCGGEVIDHEEVELYAAFYCPDTDVLVYDDGPNSLLAELAAEHGDAVFGVVLAHEYAHAVQSRAGDLDRSLPTIITEQQADCYAGAWLADTAAGGSPFLRTSDADLRGGLLAMVAVRDPVGLDPFDTGGHGSAFDRVGAFQQGTSIGPGACVGLLDEPLPLMPNRFLSEADASNDGDLPYGTAEGEIVPLILTALERYGAVVAATTGLDTIDAELVVITRSDEVSCPDPVERPQTGLAVCPGTGVVYVDDAVARRLYDEPIEGRADFAVGYLLATGWAELVQAALGSPLAGEDRALANDCLAGSFANDLDPTRPARPDEPSTRGSLSPGDLDEAVIAAIRLGDLRSDDDVTGSALEKVASFREGVLGGLDVCLERIGR
jgi:predicted metalloprotease